MQSDPFTHLAPDTRKRMLDRELVESTYRENTMREASKELGVSTGMLARALRHHGIRVRSKGERVGISRASLPGIVARAYHKAGRCPPNCPGKEQCLSENGKCVVNDYLAGKLGPIA